jgi:hypothetical protein
VLHSKNQGVRIAALYVRRAPDSGAEADMADGPSRATSGNQWLQRARTRLGDNFSTLLWIHWRPDWINQRQGGPVRFDRWLDRTLNLYHRIPR